jgi:hypothetical protein
MADRTGKQDDVLTTVARSVGKALAKVASAASSVTREKPAPRKSAPAKAQRASTPVKSRKPAKKSAPARVQQKKKIKRAKHKRALGRKTAG